VNRRAWALAAALLLSVPSAAGARPYAPPLVVATPTPVGPLARVAAVNDAACTYEALSTACQWAFELDPSATGDPTRRWFGTVGAVSVTPPRHSCLIAVRVVAQYRLPRGVSPSLIVRTAPPPAHLHADVGGWSTVLLNLDAGGAATPPATLSETVRGAPGAVSKWIQVVPQRGPGGMPSGTRTLSVITEWSGRAAGSVQIATAEEQASTEGLVIGGVYVEPLYQPGACTYVAPAGPGFYVAPALGTARQSQQNCILVRAPEPASVSWSITGPAYRSDERSTPLRSVAGYGRSCLPIPHVAAGRYLAHVVVRGGRATRRYDVGFTVTP
jgi:hypothetical protein